GARLPGREPARCGGVGMDVGCGEQPGPPLAAGGIRAVATGRAVSSGTMNKDPRVDAYLASLPPDQRELLEAVRRQVATLAPQAVETFAYAMPAFRLHDRFLVSFAGWKRHCTI